MTATIETIITCDGRSGRCVGTFANGDHRFRSALEQRNSYVANADASGRWVFYKGKDYCPVCWAERNVKL